MRYETILQNIWPNPGMLPLLRHVATVSEANHDLDTGVNMWAWQQEDFYWSGPLDLDIKV
jgi:hypothetical protein